MTGDPVMAYCGQRAIDRKSVKGVSRHAVTLFSLLSGAMDAECGTIGMVEVGPWEPDGWDPKDEPACPACIRYLKGEVPIPEDEALKLRLAEPGPAGTLSAFTDAA